MAIGTLAAIGLGLAGAGSIIGGSSQNKAATKAADSAVQVAETNNALAREIYGKNEGYLTPYVSRGNAAGDSINALLGLPSGYAAGGATGGTPGTPASGGDINAQIAELLALGGDKSGRAMSAYAASNPDLAGPDKLAGILALADNSERAKFSAWQAQNPYTPAVAATPGTPAQAASPDTARNAFRDYIDNSDYAFRFGEGANALNGGFAGRGVLQSGAAMKDLEAYKQNLQAGYRNEYTGLLQGQQSTGLSGASALAGVGQNFVNNTSANNTAAGNAQANAILAKGANNPFANALGMVGGGLFGLGK